ncbi:MAG: HOG (high osmolarity glycerol) pathway protein [Bathelium mastoideum]|nr:MAG: HOG (high osmolarity glycerol) pathway protein [Bathelium mastoideum]
MAAVLSPQTKSSSPSPNSISSKSPQSSGNPNNNTQSLPPLVTSPPLKASSARRVSAYANKRLSALSAASNTHSHSRSRPQSSVFPMFHSSLPYALVRDFAYPSFHPMHYGPPPDLGSGISTPASEAQRRLSDPQPGMQWSAVAWGEGTGAGYGYGGPQLPSTSFADGPPWSEDEDLHSPKVTAARHKKHKSTIDFDSRGRSRDRPDWRASYGGHSSNGDYLFGEYDGRQDSAFAQIQSGPPAQRQYANQYRNQHSPPSQRSPTSRSSSPYTPQAFGAHLRAGDAAHSNHHNSLSSQGSAEESRYSRDYQFTIASPDEEMHGKAIALFDFARENENELPLVEGQVILVSYRHGQGWLVAQDPISGESGLVPEEYVRLLRELNLVGEAAEGWPAVQGLSINADEDAAPYNQQQKQRHQPPSSQRPPDRYSAQGHGAGERGSYGDTAADSHHPSVTSPWTPRAAEAVTPTQSSHPGHERDNSGASSQPSHGTSASNASASSSHSGAGSGHHYVPVVSTFSTSSRDFEIQHGRAMSTPALKIPAVLQGRRGGDGEGGRKSGEGRRSGEGGRIVEERGPEDAKARLEGGR